MNNTVSMMMKLVPNGTNHLKIEPTNYAHYDDGISSMLKTRRYLSNQWKCEIFGGNFMENIPKKIAQKPN